MIADNLGLVPSRVSLNVADDAGALLVRSGLVSASALDAARAQVRQLGGTLGEQLVAAGAIGDEALTDFYRQRLLVPQVNPNTLARLPARVIGTVPPKMAIELRVIPVSLDADNNLTVAMSDPSDRRAVDEVAFYTNAFVVRAVATQMQIAWCLAHYYGHVTALGQRLMQPAAAAPAAAAPRTKGLTAKVQATRHRAIAPVTGPVAVARPVGAPLDDPRPAPPPLDDVGRASDPDLSVDGVPEARPRPRSVSGEIRVPQRRAPSIRPPMPEPLEDDSGPVIVMDARDSSPVITIEETGDDTGPTMLPVRRRPVKSDPPELAARAGEVAIADAHAPRVELETPSIVVSEVDLRPPEPVEEVTGEIVVPDAPVGQAIDVDDISGGVVIHEHYQKESEPVLLERRRPTPDASAAAPATLAALEDDGGDDVVVLEAKKRPVRTEKRTRVGIGVMPAVTRPHRDTVEAAAPDAIVEDAVVEDADDDEITGVELVSLTGVATSAEYDDTPTRVSTRAIPAAAGRDDDDAPALPPSRPRRRRRCSRSRPCGCPRRRRARRCRRPRRCRRRRPCRRR